MLTAIQHAMDRLAIRAGCASVRSGFFDAARHRAAAELLNRPDFLHPTPNAAAPQFSSPRHFTFPSAIQLASANNKVVAGRFHRAGDDWRQRPAVIMVHGWQGESGYYLSFPLLARGLVRRGVNVVDFQLPFHAARRPRGPGVLNNFLSDDLLTMLEATRQSLSDALSLRAWLQQEGCPSVSVWGYSLGGWLAGLLCSHREPFEAAVLMNPIARMDVAVNTLPFCEPAREAMQRGAVPLDVLSLKNLRRTARSVVIVEGTKDLFVPPETLEELSAAWPGSELWRESHGHISILFSPNTMGRIIDWVAHQALGRACLSGKSAD